MKRQLAQISRRICATFMLAKASKSGFPFIIQFFLILFIEQLQTLLVSSPMGTMTLSEFDEFGALYRLQY